MRRATARALCGRATEGGACAPGARARRWERDAEGGKEIRERRQWRLRFFASTTDQSSPPFFRFRRPPPNHTHPTMPRDMTACGRYPPQPFHKPIEFYAAVRAGDPAALARVMDADPYYVTQDNGAGAPLHFAVTYKQLDMVCVRERGGEGRPVFFFWFLDRAGSYRSLPPFFFSSRRSTTCSTWAPRSTRPTRAAGRRCTGRLTWRTTTGERERKKGGDGGVGCF